MSELRALPKIELHRHLEGSVRPSTILEIARQYGLPLPGEDLETLEKAVYITEPAQSMGQIFERFRLAQQSFVTPAQIERIAREVVEDAAAENTALLELRFSPTFMTDIHRLPWEEVLDAITSGVAAAQAEHAIEVGLIAICSRDYGVERCDETVDFCLEHRDRIDGIDLAGDETDWPARRFASAFGRAHRAGLHITVHAGEVAPPAEIEDALTLLYADRIGHGVSVVRSPTLMADLVEQQIPFELCPTSNYITRAIPSLAAHPLPILLRAGAVVSVSSDDPEIFGIDLTHEYGICVREMGLTVEEIRGCNRQAVAVSFVSSERRQRAADRVGAIP